MELKKLVSEFKEFATRGNAIELAIGVVIGGSFGAIVNSLVADIITPVISLLTAGADFTSLRIPLNASKELYLTYGNFIQALITFFFTTLAIFLMIKVINKVNRKPEVVEEAAEPAPSEELVLLQRIADALEQQNSKD